MVGSCKEKRTGGAGCLCLIFRPVARIGKWATQYPVSAMVAGTRDLLAALTTLRARVAQLEATVAETEQRATDEYRRRRGLEDRIVQGRAQNSRLMKSLDSERAARLSAEQERDALRADKARLDWLEETVKKSLRGVAMISPDISAGCMALWEPLDAEIPDGWCIAREAPSLRAAIDEGMAFPDSRSAPPPSGFVAP